MEDIRVTMRDSENLIFTKMVSSQIDEGFLIIKVSEKQILCINVEDIIMVDIKVSNE